MPAHPASPSRLPHACRRGRRAATLLELLVVLATVGVLLGLAVPRARGALARHATRAAARDVALLLAAARQIAATSAEGAAVRLDEGTSQVRLLVAGDTVRALSLRDLHGVVLRASRDSIAYDARGLGYGAANVTVILERDAAADTLVVSRLGRLRSSVAH